MAEKTGLTPPSPEWVEEQCRKFEQLLQGFTAEMRAAFRKRAEEGRDRWEDLDQAERLQMDLLAHAYFKPLCMGEEAHVANFACFLYGLRKRHEQGECSEVPAPTMPAGRA